jgi:hypothetical protein
VTPKAAELKAKEKEEIIYASRYNYDFAFSISDIVEGVSIVATFVDCGAVFQAPHARRVTTTPFSQKWEISCKVREHSTFLVASYYMFSLRALVLPPYPRYRYLHLVLALYLHSSQAPTSLPNR